MLLLDNLLLLSYQSRIPEKTNSNIPKATTTIIKMITRISADCINGSIIMQPSRAFQVLPQ